MEITESTIKKILTRSESGYLLNADGRGPICSHSMQPYQGCAFGNALCGVGCYVRFNTYVTKGREWGSFLEARTNAAQSYRDCYRTERQWAQKTKGGMSIFCSSSTDPFIPQEDRFGVTKSLLEAMLDLPPDLLILQTHTHRVTKYVDLYSELQNKCKLRFQVSIETDRNNLPGLPPHASPIADRLDACQLLRQRGHFVVVMVAPLLPIDDPNAFFQKVASVADAVVIDHFIIGDGSTDGKNTKRTDLPAAMALVNPESTSLKYRDRMVEIARRYMPGRVGVSKDGFAGFYE